MSLKQLIERLNSSRIQTIAEANELERARRDKVWEKMMAGKTYGEASGGLAILNQPEEQFRAHLKSIDNDLDGMVKIVEESLDNWFGKGDVPPPYYPYRIAVILNKAKRKEEEAAFLEAWCRHFGDFVGRRYEMIAARAKKLGAI